MSDGPDRASVRLAEGVQCDLRGVTDAQFPFALHYFTGSKAHNVAMRRRAIARGCKLSEYGLDGPDGPIAFSTRVSIAERGGGAVPTGLDVRADGDRLSLQLAFDVAESERALRLHQARR